MGERWAFERGISIGPIGEEGDADDADADDADGASGGGGGASLYEGISISLAVISQPRAKKTSPGRGGVQVSISIAPISTKS